MKNKNFLIKDIFAREILDSRGNPTVEVDVHLTGGATGRAGVPSGASTGLREALELRDGDPERYSGRGVKQAIENIKKTIAPAIKNFDARNQTLIDKILCTLDGTPNKSYLGANAILGVSVAVAQASSSSLKMPLYRYLGGEKFSMPTPLLNVINGGAHAENNLDIQEFMIVPYGAPTFAEAMRWASECYQTLKKILRKNGLSTGVGDEGGFAPNLKSNEEALSLIVSAIEKTGLKAGRDVGLALDVAPSAFYDNGVYHFRGEKKRFSNDELSDYYIRLFKKFPIVSIEDAFAEDDWEGWHKFTKALGSKCQIVGDDIFVTQSKILEEGIKKGVANAILIKLNQVGTISETLAVIKKAKKAGYATVISHRSGETEDVAMAHLAVAVNAGQIKAGAPCRSERLAKYNELLRIEETLKRSAPYTGKKPYKHLKFPFRR